MIRILLADDQNIIRQGLQAILESLPELKVVGTADCGLDAIKQVAFLKPDLVLIDIEMPGMSGLTAAEKINEQFPSTKVIILSSHENREYVVQALQAGAEGYLLKSTLADDLERAIWSVYRGHFQIESALLRNVLTETPFLLNEKSIEKKESNSIKTSLLQETHWDSRNNNHKSSTNSKYLPKTEKTISKSESISSSKIDQTELKSFSEKLDSEIEESSVWDRNNSFEQADLSLTKKSKIRWLWLFVSLAIFSGGISSWLWLKQDRSSATIEKLSTVAIPVKVQKLSARSIEDSSEFVGTLEAPRGINLRPETEGRIVEILVTSGKKVKYQTPLIRLRSDKGKAQLNRAIARSNSLKATIDQAESELNAAQAEQKIAAAEVHLQQAEFKRTNFLVKEGAQSSQSLDRVENDLQAALASLEAAQKRIQAAQAKVDRANADFQQTEADVDLEQENLQDTEVIAPVEGTIGDIPVKIGDYVQTDDILTTITQNQALELRLSVPIEQAAKLRLGLPVELRTSQGSNPLAVGEVSFISPKVDTASQVVLTKASFPDFQIELRDEQFVSARIIWKNTSGVLVSSSAITRLGGQAFVFVAQNNQGELSNSTQIAKQRPVKLGSIQGNNYQVIDGLKPGETLITSGLLNLFDGAPIVLEPPSSVTEASPPSGMASK